MADFSKIGTGLQGMGAWFSGQGPQWEQQQYIQREREKQMEMARQGYQVAARDDRTKNLALTIRSVGQLLDTGNIDRAVTLLGETALGAKGTPIEKVPMALYQGITQAEQLARSTDPIQSNVGRQRLDQVKQMIKGLDQEFSTRFGLPEPRGPEILDAGKITDGGQVLVADGSGGVQARDIPGYRPPAGAEPKREMREDRNGILRYIDNAEPVFPDVIDTITQLSGSDYNDIAKGIRAEIDKNTKDYQEISSAWDRLSSSQPTAAGDLALIFNYMKMLDPGSTVREGEFATAQNAGGVGTMVRNMYNRVKDGERLTPEQRNDFMSQAQSILESTKSTADLIVEQYAGIGERLGIKREDLVISRDKGQVTTRLIYNPETNSFDPE